MTPCRVIAAALLACISAATLHAQSPPPAAGPSTTAPRVVLADRVDRLDERLATLDPSNPEAYLELGEEVLAEIRTAEDRRLARELLALAFELERVRPADERRGGLMVSAGLALAMTEESSGDRRWLRAIARAISTGQSGPVTVDAPARTTVDTGAPVDAASRDALRAASVLGLARAGQGRRAERLLESGGVSAALKRVDRLLSPGELPGGVDRVRSLIASWPTCSTCRGRRYVKTGAAVSVCDRCGGKGGPHLDERELLLHIRAESALLSGSQRSWSAAAKVDSGAPLRDVDPAELAGVLGVSASRPIYRNGRWVAVSGAAAAPAPNPAPAPAAPPAEGAPASPAAPAPAS